MRTYNSVSSSSFFTCSTMKSIAWTDLTGCNKLIRHNLGILIKIKDVWDQLPYGRTQQTLGMASSVLYL